MPHVVIPQSRPPTPPLPFRSYGAVLEQGGAAVDTAQFVPVTVWPASGVNGTRGRDFDHEGEAHLDFAEELQGTNRKLVVDEQSYAIVSAVPYIDLPHVALTLRKVRAGGGG